MIDRFEKFTFLISDISSFWQKIAQDELGKYGLKSSHAIYLTTLLTHSEGMTSNNLCQVLSRDKADVSRMMNILLKEEIVIKLSENKNLYGGKFLLTEKGKNIAENIKKRAESFVSLGGEQLSDSDREVLYNSLEIIAKNLKNIYEEK